MTNISLYTQAGLIGGGALTTAAGLGASSNPGVVAGTLAMGGGIAFMAYQRLNQLRQSSAPQADLPQNRVPIPDSAVRNHLLNELSDRYAVLAEPPFVPLRDKMASHISEAWVGQGRLVDPQYPELRGYVTEALIEAEAAKIVAKLEGGAGAQQRLRDGLQSDLGNRTRRWAPVNVEEIAATALKRAYPALENTDYSGVLSGMARKVVEEWTKQGSPARMDKPGPARPLVDAMVHSQVRGVVDFLTGKPLNEKQAALLNELRKSVRSRALEPWKALLLPGALAAGVALVAAAGLRFTPPPSVESETPPTAPEAVCRRTFASDRFSARAEKPLPVPSKMAFVPAWMKKDVKAQQAWILSRFVPAYADYFECRWTERKDLDEGLRLIDEVRASWDSQDNLKIPVRLEGVENTVEAGFVTISTEVFRKAVEEGIMKKHPELLLHRTLLEAKQKDPKRDVQGPDVPEAGRPIAYEGFNYVHLDGRVVRWPEASKKLALEKELWDPKKTKWVKCLSR